VLVYRKRRQPGGVGGIYGEYVGLSERARKLAGGPEGRRDTWTAGLLGGGPPGCNHVPCCARWLLVCMDHAPSWCAPGSGSHSTRWKPSILMFKFLCAVYTAW
jgi:hypothetical protein